jgi:hypothetical protein
MEGMLVAVVLVAVIQVILIFAILKISENTKEITEKLYRTNSLLEEISKKLDD